jgi:L-alanine-DL-glutamate epimerase-like enolase superfamily enzyme
VLWTRADHERFAARAATVVPRGSWRLDRWSAEMAARAHLPHARAAFEAAAIDLALRQAATNLFRLAVRAPAPLCYVVSFDRRADPAGEIRARLDRHAGLRFKVDVDPGWPDAVYAALAALGVVATLDFKGGGTRADHERAHAALPTAFLEDPDPAAAPWSPGTAACVSFDAPLTSAAALDRLPVRPAAANVKPARLGGVFEALRCIEACARRRIPVYFGGMSEVSVGRRQLWTLASLFAPEAPNDVAPITTAAVPAPLPGRLVPDETDGFAPW